MIIHKYHVYSIDSFKDPVFEPKLIKCLRLIRIDEEKTGLLYEHTNRALPLFRVEIKRLSGNECLEVLPGDSERYERLKDVLIKHKVRGQYHLVKPFAFVLKQYEETKI